MSVLVGVAPTLVACGSDNPTAAPPVPVTSVASVTVTPASDSLYATGTLQLAAVAKDAQGNAVAGVTVTWSSSAPAMLTVSASGLVTGIAAGRATVTATAGSASGSASLSVRSLVDIAFVSDSLDVGIRFPLTATVHDVNGNVVTSQSVS